MPIALFLTSILVVSAFEQHTAEVLADDYHLLCFLSIFKQIKSYQTTIIVIVEFLIY